MGLFKKSKEDKHCPYCGKDFKPSLENCPRCGNKAVKDDDPFPRERAIEIKAKLDKILENSKKS
jgi:predicted amidophosphoribosyltransferase